jgi:hypothetical protein
MLSYSYATELVLWMFLSTDLNFLELMVNEQVHLSVWCWHVKTCISGRPEHTFHIATVFQEPFELITYFTFSTHY